MSRFKIPLILFGSVFVVSFVLAFATGSSYFSPVKALLSAVVATAFFFGAKFLLGKYIPDLFEAKDDASDSSSLGGNVDIRIQGDEGVVGSNGTLGASNDGLTEGKGPSPYVDASLSTSQDDGLSSLEGLSLEEPAFDDGKKDADKKEAFEATPSNTSAASAGNIEQENVDNKADEKKTLPSNTSTSSEDVGASNASSNASTLSNSGSPNSTSSKEEVKNGGSDEANRASSVDRIPEAELSEAVEQDVNRLEELPDLQEFVDTSRAMEQSKGEEMMNEGTQSFFETDLAENATDTNLMASAVRTMLKRE